MIVVVSYRPSGYNTCRGCVMEEWESELAFGEFETREEAADFIAKEEAEQEKRAKPGEPIGREYSVVDGELLFDGYGAKQALDELLEGTES